MSETEQEGNPNANETVASSVGEFFCELCKLEFTTKPELDEHTWSILHHGKLNKSKGRDCVHECSLCQEQFLDLLSFTSHLHSDTHQEKYNTWRKKQKASNRWQYTEELRPRSPAGLNTRHPRGARSRPPRRFNQHSNGSRGSYSGWKEGREASGSWKEPQRRESDKSPVFDNQWSGMGSGRGGDRGRGRINQPRRTRWDDNRLFTSDDTQGPQFFSFDFQNNERNDKHHWFPKDNDTGPATGINTGNQNFGYGPPPPIMSRPGIPNPSWQFPFQPLPLPQYGYSKTFEPQPQMNKRPGTFQPYPEYGISKSVSTSSSRSSSTHTGNTLEERSRLQNESSFSGLNTSVSTSLHKRYSPDDLTTGISESHTELAGDRSMDEGTMNKSLQQSIENEKELGNRKEKTSMDSSSEQSPQNREESLRVLLGIKKEPKQFTQETSFREDSCIKQVTHQEARTEDRASNMGMDDAMESSSRCSFIHIDGIGCAALTSERYCSYHKRFKESEISKGGAATTAKTSNAERSSSVPLSSKPTGLLNLNDTLLFKPSSRLDEILNRGKHGTRTSFRRASTQSEPSTDPTNTDRQITSLGAFMNRRSLESENQERENAESAESLTTEHGREASNEDDSMKMIDLSFSTRYLAQPQAPQSGKTIEIKPETAKSKWDFPFGSSTKSTSTTEGLSLSRTIENILADSSKDKRLESTNRVIRSREGSPMANALDGIFTRPRPSKSRDPPTVQPVSPCSSPPLPRTSPVSPVSSRLSPSSNTSAIRNVDFTRLNLPPNIRRALALKYAAKKQSGALTPPLPPSIAAPDVAATTSSRDPPDDWYKIQIKQEKDAASGEHPNRSSTSLPPPLPPFPRLRSSSLDSFPLRQTVLGEALRSERASHQEDVGQGMLGSTAEAVKMSSHVSARLGKKSFSFRRHSRSEGERLNPVMSSDSNTDLPSRMIDLSTASYLTSVTTRDKELVDTDRLESTNLRRETADVPTETFGRLSGFSFKLPDATSSSSSIFGSTVSKTTVPITSSIIRSSPSTLSTKASELSDNITSSLPQRHGRLSNFSFKLPGITPSSSSVYSSTLSKTADVPTQTFGRLSSFSFKPPDTTSSSSSSSSVFGSTGSTAPISSRILNSSPSTLSTKALESSENTTSSLQRHGLLDLGSTSSTFRLPFGSRPEWEGEQLTSDPLLRHGLMDLGSVALPEPSTGDDYHDDDTLNPKRPLEEDKEAINNNKKAKLDSDKMSDSLVAYAPGVDVQKLLNLECEEQVQMRTLEATQDRIREVRFKMQELARELESLHAEEKKTACTISELKSKRLVILQSALRGGKSPVPQSSELDPLSVDSLTSRSRGSLYQTRLTTDGSSSEPDGDVRNRLTNNALLFSGDPETVPVKDIEMDLAPDDLTSHDAKEAHMTENENNVVFDESVVVKIEVPDEETAYELAVLGPVVSLSSDPSEGTMVLEAEPMRQESAQVPAPLSVDKEPESVAATKDKVLRRSPRKLPVIQQNSSGVDSPRKRLRSSILLPSKDAVRDGKDSQNRKDLMKKMRHLHSGKKPQLGKRKKSFSEAKVSDTLALSRNKIQSVRERMKSWRQEQDEVEGLSSTSTVQSSAASETVSTVATATSAADTTTTVYYKDTPLTPSQVPVRDTRHPARKTTKELKKSSMFKSKRKEASEAPGQEQNKASKPADSAKEGTKSKHAKKQDKHQGGNRTKGGKHPRKKSRTDANEEEGGTKKRDVNNRTEAAGNDGNDQRKKKETAAQSEAKAIDVASTPPFSHLQVPKAAVESLKRQIQRKSKVTKSSSAEPAVAKFSGHTGAVCGIKVNHGLVFTCSADKTTKAFDVETGECIKTYEGHHHAVNCLEISEDGIRLFTGSNDQTVRSYNVKTGACTHKFTFNGRVMCLHAAFDLLFVGLSTGIVTCVDLKSNACKERLHCHDPRGVSCLATATEGQRKLLCTGSFDATITIRDSSSGLLIRTIKSHNLTVLCMQIVENILYSGAADGQVLAHNLNTGEILRKYSGHTLSVSGLQVTGRVLVTSSLDKLIRCYDLMSSELLQVYGGNKEMLFSVHMANGRIYTGARDGKVVAVKLDLRVYHPCKWEKCQLKFGMKSHLKNHVTESHTPDAQGKPTKCGWLGCDHVFENNTKAIQDHVIAHIESRDPKT